jgi:hypothetical protein
MWVIKDGFAYVVYCKRASCGGRTYCNVLGGVLFTMELYCTPKTQHTTVKHSQKLFEHTYTSNLYGLGTLTPIEFFQQDLLWQSSNTHSHSCSHKASKHTKSIRRRAIGPLAHHNGTSAYSPSLSFHLPAPTIECLHRPRYKLACFSLAISRYELSLPTKRESIPDTQARLYSNYLKPRLHSSGFQQRTS